MKIMSILGIILQTQIKTDLNKILSDYGVPIASAIILLSAVIGVVSNLDKIMDSDGRGTRKEGMMNVVWIGAGVVVAIAVIAGIVALVSNLKFNI